MIPATQQQFSQDWEAIADTILKGKKFLIATHVQADPDALGSELALAEALRLMNKEALILNPTPISANYAFLDPTGQIHVYQGEALEQYQFDAVFILDISRWERLGKLSEPIRVCGKPKICIDHHPYTGGFADFHIVKVEAAASAEIIYDLVQYLSIPMNRTVAEYLYISILSDTGVFSFSNTTPRVHQIAYDLLSFGFPSRRIFEQLYQNNSPERLKFLGVALSNMRLDCDQRLAWMTIPYDMLKASGVHPDEVDGFVDMPRNCKTVLVSILFLEIEPNDVKISLRSKGNFNSNALATRFGGGGHNHASGIRLMGPLPEIQDAVLNEARKALEALSNK